MSDKTISALAFDYGAKKTGVASGQTATRTAQALETIGASGDALIERALALVDEWKPDVIVVGLPVPADGNEDTPVCRAVKRFAATLTERSGVPVEFIDEHLSSAAADSAMRDALAPGKRMTAKQQRSRDAVAAKLILESWLAQI